MSEPISLYLADTGEYAGPATADQQAAADAAPDGVILIDLNGRPVTAAQREQPWLQPVRRVFVEAGPVLSGEGPRAPRPGR